MSPGEVCKEATAAAPCWAGVEKSTLLPGLAVGISGGTYAGVAVTGRSGSSRGRFIKVALPGVGGVFVGNT